MFRFVAKIVPLVARAALISVLLAAPVLAVPTIGGDRSLQIESTMKKNSGAGFILLVSLQRG
jgi:hypothetical protein